MIREIRVRNASIYATLGDIKIDFEIRTTKDSGQGFSLLVDGVKWLDVDLVGKTLKDGHNYEKKSPLFLIGNIKK